MTRSIRLFWRVFLLDASLFTLVAVLLLVTPITISAPIVRAEALTIVASLIAVLVLNAVLLRRAVKPLERLAERMEVVDLLRPGQRLYDESGDEIGRVVRSFNSMLARLEEERRQSGRRMLEAQESERLAIARDLHDEVGQLQTAVLLELDAAGREMDRDLAPAVSSVRTALDEVRRISRELRPEILEELGLVSALTDLYTNLGRSSGIDTIGRFDRDLPAIEPATELAMYRIAQESLTNVLRHARATRLEISIERTSRSIILKVVDDGIGIELEDEQSGGLRSMRERAILIGAALAVRPGAAGGTEVRLELPVASEAREQTT